MTPSAALLVNDIHAKLNATSVRAVFTPAGRDELSALVRSAAAKGAKLAICGGRHAMGGQQFARDEWLVDLRRHTRIIAFDQERGLLTAEAGAQWPELIAACTALHEPGRPAWSIRQKQTGADRLTLGGALAANIHGRGWRMAPIVADVEAFTLIDPAGDLHRCSRTENAERFALAIGGYGLFGLICEVTLRLMPRVWVQRAVQVISLAEFADEVAHAHAPEAADRLFGDFQFAIDERSPDFLQRGVFSSYRRLADGVNPPAAAPRHLAAGDWARLIHLAHTDRARVFEEYSRYYLSTSGQVYGSDTHQLSTYLDDYHEALDQRLGVAHRCSEMISELYVPRGALVAFMTQAAQVLRRQSLPVIYGTVRLIERDAESFLAWAREPWACIIFNLHVEHTPGGLAAAGRVFRELIDCALEHGGSYYLTYHRWATRSQVELAHPRFAAFLERKRHHDPEGRFTSDWYEHQRALFAAPAIATPIPPTPS